jgi:putative transposase
MPRACDYLLEGHTYHLTHRCQNREFHLRFKADRDAYREWLREGVRRFRVPVYRYCITGNHVHVVLHADDPDAVSGLMHLAAGSTAKRYNLRKGHLGSVWEHPYHCTIVQDGQHLLNCLRYVDLNMVRAGAISHPCEWRWCGYDELTGTRTRYRIIDTERLLESLAFPGCQHELARLHAAGIAEQIARRELRREPEWTEALAVGSGGFVKSLKGLHVRRLQTDASELLSGRWVLKEPSAAYGLIRPPQNAS